MEKPNLKYLEALSEGDLDFQNEVISILKKEFPVELNQFKTAVFHENYTKAAACIHKMKLKISMLGLQKSFVLASEYEKELKIGKNRKQQEFEIILGEIYVFLEKI
ncbi:MAG: Hpt domain-containing protein [Polaribacter sp.]|nr:Hpt domain-containing protein [Polaribacter sp.]MDG1993596.1 Hpt domain-containing protein [Polaribacter sp.]